MSETALPQHIRTQAQLQPQRMAIKHKRTLSTDESTICRHRGRFNRIILCRHGESLGNVDATTYVHTADWRIPLSDKGRLQAQDVGKRLATLIHGEKCMIYQSPYKRATETMEEMVKHLPPNSVIGTRQEPRLAEQQFGNFQNYEEVKNARDERVKFGRFFYRFPSGEAGLDVYSRITGFISTLFRESQQMRDQGMDMGKTNIVIVTHGLTLRLFLMRWLQISVEEFEEMYNPDNAFLAVMECITCDRTGNQWYELTTESANHLRIKKRMATSLTAPPGVTDANDTL